MSENSCNMNDKGQSCCSSNQNENLISHWNDAYSSKPSEKLGWFEIDLSPTLKLINQAGLDKSARIINIGAGNTTLIDELLNQKYKNIVATDISSVALNKLDSRVQSGFVNYIVDDITQPKKLNLITNVDLWIDRAVLHFFTEEKDQKTYFDLLKEKVTVGGYVILAQFNLDGALKCSGLPVKRYNQEMLSNQLGNDFELVDYFNHTYTMPSGDQRPYVYTLFKRKS